ncbi:20840_t:CDS:2 [Rhizophagus irregularis]|nr:20840_t:CDS:2 [Rhizophagus irregularis]
MRNYKFTRKWFELHIPRWEKVLGGLKGKVINVLEIGVFEGRSTVWILDELFQKPESKLITIDTFENIFVNNDNETTFRRNIKESGKELQVEIIKNNSFDALTKLNYEKRMKFDFIYIDGSHIACDVLSDAVLSWNLLKDEEFNNPRIAIDSFLKSYQQHLEVIFKRFQVGVKKVVKENPRTARDDKRID